MGFLFKENVTKLTTVDAFIKKINASEPKPVSKKGSNNCGVTTILGEDGGIPGSKVQLEDGSVYNYLMMVVINGMAVQVFEGINNTSGIEETKYYTMSNKEYKKISIVNLKGQLYTFSDGGIWQYFPYKGKEYKGNTICGTDGNLHLKLFGTNYINITNNMERMISDVILTDSKIIIKVSSPVSYSQLNYTAQNTIKLKGVTSETIQNVVVDQFELGQDGKMLTPNTICAVDNDHKVLLKKNKVLYEVDSMGNVKELKSSNTL